MDVTALRESPDINARLKTVLARVDGDVLLFRDLVSAFLVEYPNRLEQLRLALQAADSSSAAFHAHALLGSLRVLDDGSNVALVRRLEELVRAGDVVGGDALYATLVTELNALSHRLVAWSTHQMV